MKKKLNPFRLAPNIEEFFKMLRKELEALRGKPFRYWKPANFRIGLEELAFDIDCDDTKIPGNNFAKLTWYDIAEGDRSYSFRKTTKLGKWHGFGLFRSSGHGSGAKSGTTRAYGRIDMDRLPLIKNIIVRNKLLASTKEQFIEDDAELKVLRNEVNDLALRSQTARERVRDRQELVGQKFDQTKGKGRSPLTGKRNR